MPFSHLKNPSQLVLTLRRKLHSFQLDLVRSRQRSGGQKVSDIKCSEIAISPEEGSVLDPEEEMVFEPPEVVFELEEGAPLGVLVCWMEPPNGPEGAAVDCEVEPAGDGSQTNIGRHWMVDRRGRGAKEARAKKAETLSGQEGTRIQGTMQRGLRI